MDIKLVRTFAATYLREKGRINECALNINIVRTFTGEDSSENAKINRRSVFHKWTIVAFGSLVIG